MAWSQQTISFETSEGYALGDLNGQNGWTVTESSDGFITNQVITDEKSKDGNYSFKMHIWMEPAHSGFPLLALRKLFRNHSITKTPRFRMIFWHPGKAAQIMNLPSMQSTSKKKRLTL